MAGRIAGQGSNWIRRDKRLAIYLRDGCGCVYCGRGLETGAPLTLDHLLACELGGQNEPSNLVTCCGTCNSSKQDMPMADWLQALADRGVDVAAIADRIRAAVAADLTPFRQQAKQQLAQRGQSDE